MSDVELLHFSEENLHTGEGARVLHQCGVPATYKIHTSTVPVFSHVSCSDPDALKKWAGAPLAPILESLAALEDAHAHVWLRCPVIPGVNDTDAHFEAICALKHQYTCIEKAEIMAYHDIGKTKWDALGIPYSLAALKTVSPEQKHIWETKIAD